LSKVTDINEYRWQKQMRELLDWYENTDDLQAVVEAIELCDKQETKDE